MKSIKCSNFTNSIMQIGPNNDALYKNFWLGGHFTPLRMSIYSCFIYIISKLSCLVFSVKASKILMLPISIIQKRSNNDVLHKIYLCGGTFYPLLIAISFQVYYIFLLYYHS